MPEWSPLPYHVQLRDLLRSEERPLWDWYSSDRQAQGYADAVRFELLKTTYRMDPASHAELYAAAARVQAQLGLSLPLAFYQAQEAGGLNAGLCFAPGEVHIVLSGPIFELLSGAELAALIAHELAHYQLWTVDDGSFRIMSEIVDALASQDHPHPSHVTTAARLRRFSEIYADRVALQASGDPLAVIACLVKTTTGVTEVDPHAYLRQAEELLSRDVSAASESFVRARALQLWNDHGAQAEPEIAKIASGVRSLAELDRLDQVELSALTRTLIDVMLQPEWLRSAAVLAHARRYFPHYEPGLTGLEPAQFAEYGADVRDYFALVLLDFAAADSDMLDLALGHALRCADALGLDAALEKAARRELKLAVKDLAALRERFPAPLETTSSEEASP